MRRTSYTLTALALSVAMVACDDGNDGPGSLSLLLTDDPGDFTEAIVQIDRIELIGSGAPVVLMDTPFTTDLLTLSNDVATLVQDYPVSGSFNELRLIIPAGCVGQKNADDETEVWETEGFGMCEGPVVGELRQPSSASSGFKVKFKGGGVDIDGERKILLLDVDVAQTFGPPAGASGARIMDPIVWAEDIGFTGEIDVNLSLADGVDLTGLGSLDDFQARLDTETEPVEFAERDGVWTATFMFLMPGDHEVTVEFENGATYTFVTDPVSPQVVTLTSEGDESIDFVITEVVAS